MDERVLVIVGGGIGGLSLAALLQQHHLKEQKYQFSLSPSSSLLSPPPPETPSTKSSSSSPISSSPPIPVPVHFSQHYDRILLIEKDFNLEERDQGYSLTMQSGGQKLLRQLGIENEARKRTHFLVSRGFTTTSHKGEVLHVGGKPIPKPNPDGTYPPIPPTSLKQSNFPIPRQLLRQILFEFLIQNQKVDQCKSNDLIYEETQENYCQSVLHSDPTPMTILSPKQTPDTFVEIWWGTSVVEWSLISPNLLRIAVKKRKSNKSNTDNTDSSQSENVIQWINACGLIGCDGMWSTIRHHLLNDPPQSTGLLMINGIGSANHPFLYNRVLQMLDGCRRVFTKPYTPTTSMWQLTFPCPEGLKLPLEKSLLKEIAIRETNNWSDPIPTLIHNSPVELMRGAMLYDRDPIPISIVSSWNGPVTLLGDALHPMTPFKGQGEIYSPIIKFLFSVIFLLLF
jgi:2-polyprenyl-6-methoxyphenol hydroxylase-like FAD-dependent oxidoreductase